MKGTDVRLQSRGQYRQLVWRDRRGVEHTECVGNKAKVSKAEAERLRRAKQAEIDADPTIGVAGRAPVLDAYFAKYIERLEATHAPGTVALAKVTRKYLAEKFTESIRMDAITPGDAADFAAWLKTAKGLTAATVCQHVRRCKTVWKDAADREVLGGRSPWRDQSSNPPKRKKPAAPVDDQKIRDLCDACPSSQWRALFALCAWGGLRRGEALRMTWADVQWDRHRLFVGLPADKTDEDTKHRERFTLLCPELEAALREVYEAAGARSKGPCDGIELGDLHRRAREIIRRAGMVPWEDPFHALRRWRVSTWKLRYPAPVVDEWCGHSADVSEEHYFNVTDSTFGLEAEVARLKAELKNLQTPDKPEVESL